MAHRHIQAGTPTPMLRRRTLLATLPAAVAAPLAGCGGSNSTNETSSGGGDGSPVTLTYGIWDAAFKPGLEKVIAEFNKQTPNITVKIQPITGDKYWTKMQAAASSGTAPDVFWMNEPHFLEYALHGQLLPLSESIESDSVDTSQFPDGLIKAYQVDNKQFALPWITAMVGLWYNKDLFDRHHVDYPDDSWDWQSVRDAASELTEKSKGVYGIAAAMSNQLNYYNTILQAGGFVISDDFKQSGFGHPEAIEGIQFWTDFIKNGTSPTLQQMTDTTPDHLFESEKVAMFYGGSWEAGTFAEIKAIKDKVAVAELPKGRKRGTTVEGAANVIYAKTQHPHEAWELVKFMESKKAQSIQAKTGIVLPAHAGTQESWVQSAPEYDLQNLVDELEYASPYPHSQNTDAWQTAQTKYLTPAWTLSEAVPSACQKLADAMNAVLAKEK